VKIDDNFEVDQPSTSSGLGPSPKEDLTLDYSPKQVIKTSLKVYFFKSLKKISHEEIHKCKSTKYYIMGAKNTQTYYRKLLPAKYYTTIIMCHTISKNQKKKINVTK
jgi:hypothetical protein